MNAFVQGFSKGAKEMPLAFFAPAIAVWRLLVGVTDSLLEQDTVASLDRGNSWTRHHSKDDDCSNDRVVASLRSAGNHCQCREFTNYD